MILKSHLEEKIKEKLDGIAVFQNSYKLGDCDYYFYRWRNQNLILRVYYPYYLELESYRKEIFNLLSATG